MLRQILASGSPKVGKWPPSGSGRGEEGDNILRFELLSVGEVMAYYAFFLKKIKVISDFSQGVKRQAKHSTNYSGWRQTATSCKGTNQNNRPLLKGHRASLPPFSLQAAPCPPPPSGLCLKASPPAQPASAHAI